MKNDLRQHLLTTRSDTELARWFDPLEIQWSKEERLIRVLFPHAYFAQWFASAHQARFEADLLSFLGSGYRIAYDCHAESPDRPGQAKGDPAKLIDFPFGQQFTFDTFLHNKKNFFPHATAQEVARKDEIIFNPFIICGESGSGKTHLLKAIANDISRRQGLETVFLGTAEDLHTLYATRFKDDPLGARNHLRAKSHVIIDDLQLLRRHPWLQSELVLLMGALHDAGKQMVFSSSEKVSAMDYLDPNLKSRLDGGLQVALKRPDLEVRVKFVQSLSRQRKLGLDKEQILTLANRFDDFRSMQGIFLKLLAFRELVQRDMTDDNFEQILSHAEDRPSETLRADYILQAVSDHFSIPMKDLLGAKRHQRIVLARQLAMYLCRTLLGSSFPALGRLFGGKDHSTVLYSVRKIEESQKVNRDMKNVLSELKKKCRQLAEKGI